jgi:hypothetical protein
MDQTQKQKNEKQKQKHEQGQRFIKQLLLIRYKTLIQRLKTTYNLNDIQVQKLEVKILNINWLS